MHFAFLNSNDQVESIYKSYELALQVASDMYTVSTYCPIMTLDEYLALDPEKRHVINGKLAIEYNSVTSSETRLNYVHLIQSWDSPVSSSQDITYEQMIVQADSCECNGMEALCEICGGVGWLPNPKENAE